MEDYVQNHTWISNSDTNPLYEIERLHYQLVPESPRNPILLSLCQQRSAQSTSTVPKYAKNLENAQVRKQTTKNTQMKHTMISVNTADALTIINL